MNNLVQSEVRHRQIVNDLTIGVYVATPDDHIVEANPAFLKMTGYASLEAINQVGMPALYADPADYQRLITMLQQGPIVGFETLFHRPDGQIVNISISVRQVQESGVAPYIEGFLEDITERKRLEREIQDSLARRSTEVQISTEIAQEIAAAPVLEELFQRVVTLIKERFDYYHAQIFRYDPTLDAVVLVTGYGEAGRRMLAAGHKLAMGRGVVGTAAATGQSILATDVAQDKDWRPNPHLPNTQGELAVPIKLRDEVLGILDVQSEMAGALTAEDQLLLEGLCGQIAIAIDNVRLVEKTQAALAESQSLLRLSSSIISFENLPHLLQSVVDNVAELLPANRVSLIGFNLEKHVVTHFVKGGPGSSKILTTVTFDELWDGLSGWALRERKPALSLKDVPDPRESPVVQQRRLDTDCGAIIVTPLIYRDRVLGAMTAINRPDEANFTQKNVDLMVAMANQVAVAIENTRLLEETQNALNEVQQSEELMRTLIDNIPNPIFYKDVHGVYQGCNVAFEKYLGRPRDQIIGRSVFDIAPKDLADKYHAKDVELFEQPGTQVYESAVVYADGARHDVIFNKATLFSPDGAVAGLVGIIIDISERKQFEASLTAERNLMRTLIDALPDYIYVKDVQGRNILVNAAMARAYGLDAPEEAIGKSDFDFYPRELAERYYAAEQPILREGKALIGFEEPSIDATGRPIWHSSTKVPLKDQEGKIVGLVGITRNITERKQTAEALRQHEVQMQEMLDELERLNRALTREGWQSFLQTGQLVPAYRYDQSTIQPAQDLWTPQIEQAIQQNALVPSGEESEAAVAPISVRGTVIGALGVYDDPQHPLSPDELTLLQEILEQGALALESARLYQDTQRRAARERLVGEVTGRIRETLNVEAVLRTAADEIRQALQLDRLVVRLGTPGEDAVRRIEKGNQDVEQD